VTDKKHIAKPLFDDISKAKPLVFNALFAPWQKWDLDGDKASIVVIKTVAEEIRFLSNKPKQYKKGDVWDFAGFPMEVAAIYSRDLGKSASIAFVKKG
jgi:hypothetical protein